MLGRVKIINISLCSSFLGTILQRLLQKLIPIRLTTIAVNLHICVATIAAHIYERGEKEINQYSILK